MTSVFWSHVSVWCWPHHWVQIRKTKRSGVVIFCLFPCFKLFINILHLYLRKNYLNPPKRHKTGSHHSVCCLSTNPTPIGGNKASKFTKMSFGNKMKQRKHKPKTPLKPDKQRMFNYWKRHIGSNNRFIKCLDFTWKSLDP